MLDTAGSAACYDAGRLTEYFAPAVALPRVHAVARLRDGDEWSTEPMDVQCERCKTEYEFDDALVSGRGTTVRCTNCGHQFKVSGRLRARAAKATTTSGS